MRQLWFEDVDSFAFRTNERRFQFKANDARLASQLAFCSIGAQYRATGFTKDLHKAPISTGSKLLYQRSSTRFPPVPLQSQS
jgi:hypothetical protein